MLTALSNGINSINGQDRSGVGESGRGASVEGQKGLNRKSG